MPHLRHNIVLLTSLYRVPGLNDAIALKRLCAMCQNYVTILPLKPLALCAMVTWDNCAKTSKTSVCHVPVLRDNISPKRSLYRVPCLHATVHENVCVPCGRFSSQYFLQNVCIPWPWVTWQKCPETSVCCVPDSRDNISPKTSLWRVSGFHETIALQHLFAVCQINETITHAKRLYTVCQDCVTQLS